LCQNPGRQNCQIRPLVAATTRYRNSWPEFRISKRGAHQANIKLAGIGCRWRKLAFGARRHRLRLSERLSQEAFVPAPRQEPFEGTQVRPDPLYPTLTG
jgi:hypothetical protein